MSEPVRDAAVPLREMQPAEPLHSRLLADARSGLFAVQKELPPTYFYDAAGSQLFDEITRLPEYYLTRTERWILEHYADAIIAAAGPASDAELGAGMATKSRILIQSMRRAGGREYVPIDVDADTLDEVAIALREEFPGLRVTPVAQDLRDSVRVPRGTARPMMYSFLGSTIGNFPPVVGEHLVRRIAATLGPDDTLLLGADLVKDVAIIEAAYNDSQGITAEFNRNVLRVINRELGADFVPERFEHRAFFDRPRRRIEMHLVSTGAQRVEIPGVGIVRFRNGESIRTEISCKYDRQSLERMLAGAGLEIARWWTDPREWFALLLARPAA
jgi:L-histidine N-alpha-methyltransferase